MPRGIPRSQSFIHQVRILSRVFGFHGESSADGRNPLFIKSEFSLDVLLGMNNPNTVVAILYSSSQNSLTATGASSFSRRRQGRNPLFIKSEFSHAVLTRLSFCPGLQSQSFIHQVRILSPVEFRLHQGTTNPESQSFIHQVRILS